MGRKDLNIGYLNCGYFYKKKNKKQKKKQIFTFKKKKKLIVLGSKSLEQLANRKHKLV